MPITIADFLKVELKAGTVLEAESIEGSEKLLKLKVDLGEEKPRQILAGLKLYYKPEYFINKQFIFVANLEPRMMMGLESCGMILCAGDKKPVPLKPVSKVPSGSRIG